MPIRYGDGKFSHVRSPTYWSILLTSEKVKRRQMGDSANITTATGSTLAEAVGYY
jgi:hypothetical protein